MGAQQGRGTVLAQGSSCCCVSRCLRMLSGLPTCLSLSFFSFLVLPPDESTLLTVLPLSPEPGDLLPSQRAAGAGTPWGRDPPQAQLASGG